jgi:hypothetical protein
MRLGWKREQMLAKGHRGDPLFTLSKDSLLPPDVARRLLSSVFGRQKKTKRLCCGKGAKSKQPRSKTQGKQTAEATAATRRKKAKIPKRQTIFFFLAKGQSPQNFGSHQWNSNEQSSGSHVSRGKWGRATSCAPNVTTPEIYSFQKIFPRLVAIIPLNPLSLFLFSLRSSSEVSIKFIHAPPGQ